MSTSANETRRDINYHAQIEKAIEFLRRPPRTASLPPKNQQPPNSATLSILGDHSNPDAFLSAMGLSPRAGNVPATTLPTKPELKLGLVPAGTKRTTINSASQHETLSVKQVPGTTQALATLPLPCVESAARVVPPLAQATMPFFVNTSSGMTSSRYATQQPIASPSPHLSWTASSVSNLETPIPAALATSFTPSDIVSNTATTLKASDLKISTASSDSSRFGPVSVSPSVTKSTLKELPVSNDLLILFEKSAKAGRNGAEVIDGKIRLVKVLNSIVIEFEQVKKKSSRSNGLQWKLGFSPAISFRLAHFTEFTFTDGSDTYTVKFQLPHVATNFENILNSQFITTSSPSRLGVPATETVGLEAPLPTSNSPGNTTYSSVPDSRPLALAEAPATAFIVSGHIGPSLAPISNASTSDTSRSVFGDPIDMSQSATAACGVSIPESLPISNDSDPRSESVLIDYSDDSPRRQFPSNASSAEFDYLLCMNNDFMVEDVLKALNRAAGGHFLDSNRETSAEELLSLVESFTLSHLKIGAAFRKGFSETTGLAYTIEIAKRALELALSLDQQAFCAKERRSPRNMDDVHSYSEDLALPGATSTFGNNCLQQMNDPEQLDKSRQVDESIDAIPVPRKYSVQELCGLHDHALAIVRQLPQPSTCKIAARSKKPSGTHNTFVHGNPHAQGLQDQPQQPSREEIVPKLTNSQHEGLFRGQGSSDTNTGTMFTIEQNPQTSKVTCRAETPTKTQHPQIEATLNGSIWFTKRQYKSAKSPSESKHHAAVSEDLTKLSRDFADLKIDAIRQKESAPLTTPEEIIFDNSNRKEDMEAAGFPGLSTSKWGADPTPVPRHLPTFSSLATSPPPQYAPIYRTILIPDINHSGRMQVVSGMEVIGTAPLVAHQIVSRLTDQDNSSVQSFSNTALQGYPTRSENFPPHPSAFSYARDSKLFSASTSPRDSPRPALSPRKANIRETFKQKVHQSRMNRGDNGVN